MAKKNIKLSRAPRRLSMNQSRQVARSLVNSKEINVRFIRQANIKNNSVAGSDQGANGGAKSYLRSFGCGLMEVGDMSKSDYSLLRSLCRDIETIENPNIFDSDAYSNLRNQGVVATDKFVNTDDPFYKLDDGLSRIEREQITDIRNKSGANFVQFAADLYEYTNSTKLVDSNGNVTLINKSRISISELPGAKAAERQDQMSTLLGGGSQKLAAPGSSTAQRQMRQTLAPDTISQQARAEESALTAIRAGKVSTSTRQQARAEESALTAIRAGKVSTSTRQQARKETKKKAKKETTLKY